MSEVATKVGSLEADQICCEDTFEEFFADRKTSEDLGRWEGYVEEETYDRGWDFLADHLRDEHQVIVVDPDCNGGELHQLHRSETVEGLTDVPFFVGCYDYVCEALVHSLVLNERFAFIESLGFGGIWDCIMKTWPENLTESRLIRLPIRWERLILGDRKHHSIG